MKVDVYKVRYHHEHGVQVNDDTGDRTVHHLSDAKEVLVGVVSADDIRTALLALDGDAEGVEIKGQDVVVRGVEVFVSKKKKSAE